MNLKPKYSLANLKKLVKQFEDGHPETNFEEYWTPVNENEANGARYFLEWLERGKKFEVEK